MATPWFQVQGPLGGSEYLYSARVHAQTKRMLPEGRKGKLVVGLMASRTKEGVFNLPKEVRPVGCHLRLGHHACGSCTLSLRGCQGLAGPCTNETVFNLHKEVRRGPAHDSGRVAWVDMLGTATLQGLQRPTGYGSPGGVLPPKCLTKG